METEFSERGVVRDGGFGMRGREDRLDGLDGLGRYG